MELLLSPVRTGSTQGTKKRHDGRAARPASGISDNWATMPSASNVRQITYNATWPKSISSYTFTMSASIPTTP